MKFYLVRHGQTLFNTQRLIQGWCDSPLTPLGIQQAKDVKTYLDTIPFDSVYSSTQERAVDTANIISEGWNLKVHPRKNFKEHFYGTLEGKSVDGVNWKENTIGFKHVDGEDFVESRKRFMDGLYELIHHVS